MIESDRVYPRQSTPPNTSETNGRHHHRTLIDPYSEVKQTVLKCIVRHGIHLDVMCFSDGWSAAEPEEMDIRLECSSVDTDHPESPLNLWSRPRTQCQSRACDCGTNGLSQMTYETALTKPAEWRHINARKYYLSVIEIGVLAMAIIDQNCREDDDWAGYARTKRSVSEM